MGLISAALSSVNGVLRDEWREYFYCESLDANVLAAKGQKRTKTFSSNRGNDNIISNGSIIAINEGQAMIIVEQGEVVEFCAEPGEFVWDQSTEPSLLFGDLEKAVLDSFDQAGRRFTFGGETAKDQRVYYFNTKEIVGNKYGTAAPVPFRVVDANCNMDLDISVRCNGEYSYKITDPLLFYKNVCGNVESVYTRDKIDAQLKTELLTALQPAFSKISDMGIRYSSIPAHTVEVADALNEVLSAKWAKTRGIKIASFGVNTISASEEDQERIKNFQTAAALRDPALAMASNIAATNDAMRTAAANEGGAVNGFIGMGMAGAGAASSIEALSSIAAKNAAADAWTCVCGAQNTGNFCAQCGAKKPAPAGAWKCECGAENTGNFCPQCGAKKPAAPGAWTCECGAENTGNFCADCGKPRA